MGALRAHARIGLKCRRGPRNPFFRLRSRGVVIDEGTNRDQLRQFRHGAVVVSVKVRQEEIVDLLDAGCLRGRENAIRIACFRRIAGNRRERTSAGKSGVDQQRFAGRRYHQCGLPAFDVDEIDVERLLLGRGEIRYEPGDHHEPPADLFHRSPS